VASTLTTVAAGCEGAMCGEESRLCSRWVGEGAVSGGKFSWAYDGVGKVAAYGKESGWGSEASVVRCSRFDDLISRNLGGPNAEAVTGGAKETPERRARRTHCGRSSGSPDAIGQCLLRSRFGLICVVYEEVEYSSSEI